MKTFSSIEPLEARIAPAAVLINPTTATFTDVDGDLVTVKFSKPILTTQNISSVLQLVGAGLGEQLVRIVPNALAAPADDTNITLTARPQDVNGDGVRDGDGLVNVGEIRALPLDLGIITIPGDLGAIDAGDSITSPTDFAVKALNVRSLGALGLASGISDITSDIRGVLGALNVKGDVKGYVHVVGNGTADTHAHGRIGAITVGGSLVGGGVLGAGSIQATGDIGVVKIKGDIRGGSATATGSLQSDFGAIKSVTLGGSLLGGTVQFSGQIRSNADLGPVKITGDVQGGEAPTTGFIASYTGFAPSTGKVLGVTIGGSLLLSDPDVVGAEIGLIFSQVAIGAVKIGRELAGGILSDGTLGTVTVGGSVTGSVISEVAIGAVKIGGELAGSIDSDGTLGAVTVGGSVTGIVFAERIGNVTVGGSILAGIDASGTAGIVLISSFQGIGSIVVKGSIAGTAGSQGVAVVAISTGEGGIKSLTVSGSVSHARITAGGFFRGGSIDTVKVGGDWIASSLAAGVSSTNAYLGDNDDFVVQAPLTSRIGSITIGGQVIGTAAGSTFESGIDRFAFIAREIGAFKTAGFTAKLTAATDVPVLLSRLTADVALREI